MSKEQAKEIPSFWRNAVMAWCLLMIFTPLWPESAAGLDWRNGLAAGLAAFTAAWGLDFLLGPALLRRPWIVVPLFLPLALPRLFPLFPVWIELGLLILPATWLLFHLKTPWTLRATLPLLLAFFSTPWVGQNGGDWLTRLAPSTRAALALWILIPFWFCLRKPWRVFAIPLSRFTLTVFLAGLSLLPLTQWVPLSFKTPAEAETRDRATPPAPRFQTNPLQEMDEVIPQGFTLELISFLHERQESLREESLLKLFENAPVPPEEMIRAMLVYGFLQRDGTGFHVPTDAFRPVPATQLAPEHLIWVERLREHASVSSDELQPDLFRAALRHRILLPAFPGIPRFRLSADFRAELGNALLPRQVLTLAAPSPEAGPSLSIEDYASRWNLSLSTAEAELGQLAELGYLRPVRWERTAVAAPTLVPDTDRGLRIFVRLLSTALALALLWRLKDKHIRVWLWAGLAAAFSYSASLLAASAPHQPAAAATALWLTPPALLLLAALAREMRNPPAAATSLPKPHKA